MKYSGFDFEAMGKVISQPARAEKSLPLPAGYPYPKLAAAPEMIDGWPVCRWFVYPERLRRFNLDLGGCGVPAEALPLALRPFSLNGFYIKLLDGKLELVAGRNGARREQICRDHLERAEAEILDALREVGEI